jgi:hypothetical protein
VDVDHRDVRGHDPAERPRGGRVNAEQRLAGHVVEIDLDGGAAAQRRAVARHPFAASVVLRLAGDLVALGGEQGQERGLYDWPIGLHGVARQAADVVQVDVHRQAVQRQVEHVQGCAAL